jgi:hypothetical protein
MSSIPSINKTAARTNKYSLEFLAVFAVFLIATTICVAGTLIGVFSARPSHHDTICFWTSSHLLVRGSNPYDQQAIGDLQARLGFPVDKSHVFITREPPPALFLMLPLGWLGPRIGAVAWSLILAAFFALSMWAIRGIVNGPYERGYLLLAWFFAPALCCIEVGQTGLITLLGLALLLRFEKNAPFWAGAALSLCAAKPHLFLPFGLVLLAWVVARKRWAILAGAIAALAIETAVVMLFDHAVWTHYRAAMRSQQIAGEFIPTFGVALRFLVHRTTMWLEFVPAILGSAWALWYFRRNHTTWNWRTHGSLVVLVSLMVAPYAWFTDQVLALPAILFALLRPGQPRKGSVTLLMALMSAAAVKMMTASLFFKPDMAWSAAWLAWYLYAISKTIPSAQVAVAG